MTDFVRGIVRTLTVAFTRPSDTTAYAAGDVMNDSSSAGTVLTIGPFSRSGAVGGVGSGTILQDAILVSSANQATKPEIDVYLFDTTLTADNDNAAWTPTDAELATCVAVLTFSAASWKAGTATAGAGGNAVYHLQNLGIPINTARTDNALYAVFVARNAYTPVSAEVFTLRLKLLD